MASRRPGRHSALYWAGLVLVVLVALVVILALRGARTPEASEEIPGAGSAAASRQGGETSTGFASITDDPSWDPVRKRRGSCRPVGTVTWQDGAPAVGATIEILHDPIGEQGSYRAWIDTGIRTDDSGAYRLPRQDRCPLRLAATVPGEGRGIEETLPWFDGQGVDPYPNPYRRDIVIGPARLVGGRVVDPQDEPIAGATVYLSTWRALEFESGRLPPELKGDGWDDPELVNEMYSSWSRSVQTDEEGRFRFDSVEPQRYVFRGEAPGYTHAQLEQTVRADEVPSPVRIQLTPIESRTVQVRTADGQPIGGATVWLAARSDDSVDRDQRSLVAEQYLTGPDGTVTFEEFDILGRDVVASARGFEERAIRTTPDMIQPYLVQLGPGGCVSGSLPPAYSQQATCFAQNDSRYRSALPGVLTPMKQVAFEPTGEFELCGYPPGVARLWLHCNYFGDGEFGSGPIRLGEVAVEASSTTFVGRLTPP